jgi:ribonuclease P protein component
METIKKNEEFQLIYKKGSKHFGYYFLLYIKKNEENHSRFGVVVSKKTGNAVCRVRLKRLFREIFRKDESKLKDGYDYVFIAKRNAGQVWKTLKCNELHKDVTKVFKRSGVLK